MCIKRTFLFPVEIKNFQANFRTNFRANFRANFLRKKKKLQSQSSNCQEVIIEHK